MKRKQATVDEILYGPRPKVKGIMQYDQKTGGRLVVVTDNDYAEINRAHRRQAYGSNLRKTQT